MLCPYCLVGQSRFPTRPVAGNAAAAGEYFCPACGESIPRMYVRDYARFPPIVVSAIGYPKHGKTVYCAALFHKLRQLADLWPGFYSLALDEESLTTVYDRLAALRRGELPQATPRMFPRPTLYRLSGIPAHRDCTLVIYDTSGESFERPSTIGRYARFVTQARSALLFVSLPDLWEEGSVSDGLMRLLNTYLLGLGELGSVASQQHLVVVFTKSDLLECRLAAHSSELGDDLRSSDTEGLDDGRSMNPLGALLGPVWSERIDDFTEGRTTLGACASYVDTLQGISGRLRDFTLKHLDAREFVRLADQSFHSVSYSLVSALGEPPRHNRPVDLMPCRVLDPLLWVIYRHATPGGALWQLLQSGWKRWVGAR